MDGFITAADWRTVDLAAWQARWPNFHPSEFACRGNPGKDSLKISTVLLDKLQALRNAVKKPMVVNSGYRSPEYNKLLDGAATHSQHVLGCAADIAMGNFNGEQAAFFETARRLGFTGFGFYPQERNNFMHLDIRQPGAGRAFDWWGPYEAWGIDLNA